MTLAAVDRLVHHATIFEMNVESYRRRTAQARRTGAGRPAAYTTPKVLETIRVNQDENDELASDNLNRHRVASRKNVPERRDRCLT